MEKPPLPYVWNICGIESRNMGFWRFTSTKIIIIIHISQTFFCLNVDN